MAGIAHEEDSAPEWIAAQFPNIGEALPTALYEGLTINQLPEKFQMLEVISNPILGGMIATFAIGMTFTVWSVVDDWMWDRKNK